MFSKLEKTEAAASQFINDIFLSFLSLSFDILGVKDNKSKISKQAKYEISVLLLKTHVNKTLLLVKYLDSLGKMFIG